MVDFQQKVNQQVNRAESQRAHPEHRRAVAEAGRQPRVRVEPTQEDYRRVLRHPNGMAFRAEGSVEWPFDRFTQRRIADGSIKVVEVIEPTSTSSTPPATPTA